MNDETLKAWRGSVAKWEAIVAGEGTDEGGRNCPLCAIFYDRYGQGNYCYGCPVRAKTSQAGCDGTPYQDWSREQRRLGRSAGDGTCRADTPELLKLAQAELDFLKSLEHLAEAP
jgi:hypothetical protein